MTDTIPTNMPAPKRKTPDWAMFAVAGAAILAALWFLTGDSGRALQRGATGFSGLESWLKAEGFDARTFRGGGTLLRGDVGLRILPLFDTDLEASRTAPATRQDLLAETAQQDIRRAVVQAKIEDQPTLVILPKWRTGMPVLGVAHRSLLIPADEIDRLVGQIGLEGVSTARDGSGYSEKVTREQTRVGLMHRQTLRGTGCEPLLGTPDALLLGRCVVPVGYEESNSSSTHFWVLADPDLLNNHGLGLSENAATASVLARRIGPERSIVLDLTRIDHTVAEDREREQRERTWEDFARLFRWPFTMIWVAFLCLGALVLWRAVVRFGPVARAAEDQPRASKEVSIDAKARLLRMAGQDRPLLVEHVKARITHLAAEVLGPQVLGPQASGPQAQADRTPLELLYNRIARRDPALADALAEAAHIPEGLSPDDVIQCLDRFETCYDKVIHGFGRTPGAG